MTGRRVHHPTYEEYMGLIKHGTRAVSQAHRIPVSYFTDDPAEAHRVIDATLHDLERGNFKAQVGGPPLGRIWPPERDWRHDHKPHRGCLGAACPERWAAEAIPEMGSCRDRGHLCHVTPCEACPERQGATLTREPAEPKGPLALRLRLWWMRRRLWWMRARLDGQPTELLWKCAGPAVLGSTAMSALIDAFDGPSVWWSLPIAPVLAWCLSGGWRTPTVDQVIREAS